MNREEVGLDRRVVPQITAGRVQTAQRRTGLFEHFFTFWRRETMPSEFTKQTARAGGCFRQQE
jgi:hypothetical protein